MNNSFFVGVVEDRMDPLKLGRIRVRVFGVHTELLSDIPTDKLPWAVPIMPATSASISCLGHSPTQYVEGTYVYVFFADGESKQEPIVLGSIHGVPIEKTPFAPSDKVITEKILIDLSGDSNTPPNTPSSTSTENPVPTTSNPTNTPPTATVTPATSGGDSIGTAGGTTNPTPTNTPAVTAAPSGGPVLSNADTAFRNWLAQRESSNNYQTRRPGSQYLGKYQMGVGALIDAGYVKRGTPENGAALDNPANWTGKGGITSATSFLNNGPEQERAFNQEMIDKERYLRNNGVINANTTPAERYGWLAAAHLVGQGGAKQIQNGVNKTDQNNVSGTTYYREAYRAVTGAYPAVLPGNTTASNPYR